MLTGACLHRPPIGGVFPVRAQWQSTVERSELEGGAEVGSPQAWVSVARFRGWALLPMPWNAVSWCKLSFPAAGDTLTCTSLPGRQSKLFPDSGRERKDLKRKPCTKFHYGAERWTTSTVKWQHMPSLAASLKRCIWNPASVLTRQGITGICLHLAGISSSCPAQPRFTYRRSISSVSCTVCVITHITVSLETQFLPNSNPCQSQGAFHVGPSLLHLIMNLITASINHLLRGSYLKPTIDLF